MDAPPEEVDLLPLWIGKHIANRLAFHRDLADDAEVWQREDGCALITSVGDVEPIARDVRAHRDQLLRRGDLGGVEDGLSEDGAAFRIHGDDALAFRKSDVECSAGTDGN